jgi:SAM-dependent methyltransferase
LQDLEFYARLAHVTGGPILELGCGTGRLTRPLAAIGYEVVGVDRDPQMLEWSAPRVEVVEADMRDFDVAARFPLVIVPYNTLQLLPTVADQQACFASMARHLLPDGVVGLEVTDFLTDATADVAPTEPLAEAEGIALYGALVTDALNRLTHYERRYVFDDGAEVIDRVTLRDVDEDDLAALAAGVGLEVDEAHRDGRSLSWVARASSTRVTER